MVTEVARLRNDFITTLPANLKLELVKRAAVRNAAASTLRFDPLPWQRDPYADWANFVVLLTGSAGGGKSFLAAQKLHWLCMTYPGAMVVGLRKTRESMVNSTVLFLDSTIIRGAADLREGKHRFEYPNGSIFAYGGMKDREQREQIRSIGRDGGLDAAWMEEANAFDESDFNEILPRMRAKASPYRQLILSTNPDSPLHWIYNKLIIGGIARVYYSHARDNIYNPPDYKDTLDLLTGIEAFRLREGLWVQAEGLIYDTWSDGPPDGNVTEAAEFVPGHTVLWAADDGYSGEIDPNTSSFTGKSHPRVFLLCQLINGSLNVFAEHYAIKTQTEDHIAAVRSLGYPDPDYVAVDKTAAALKGRLYSIGFNTMNGPASVAESIKEMRRRLSPDGNGRRQLFVHPRCKHLRREMVTYAWTADGLKPIEMFDHGPDALRYLCWTIRFGG